MPNKNKTIFLIYDGEVTYWSNSKSESLHTKPEDITEYVRADIIIEKDKLLHQIFSDITKDNRLSPDTFDRLVETVKNG